MGEFTHPPGGEPKTPSPRWGSTTKLVVGLTFVAIVAAFLVQFRAIIGPMILAFILAYVLHPIATWSNTRLRIPWRTSVNLIYLFLVILVGAMITLTGLAIVQQLQSLVGFVQRNVTNLPAIAADLSKIVYTIGPFEINLGRIFDLPTITDRLLAAVQPLLGRAGSLVSTFATSAAVTLGWGLFVLVISYFLLADAGRMSYELVHIDVPGYDKDIRRLAQELGKIWNAFLRGQLIIIALVIVAYSVLMLSLGVRFAIGIAILAGVARFIPYLGPLVLWIVTVLVAFFQGDNYFGLLSWQYALLVVGVALIVDQVFDNLITPRFLGQALGVHPAAVLIAAIVAARLIGIIGLVLAAPVLATLKLLSRYTLRMMLDLEPWPLEEVHPLPTELPWTRSLRRFKAWLRIRRRRPG